jgi:hypothetical protein
MAGMIEEKVIEMAATDTAAGGKEESKRALVGKIARLPKPIREELNRRLDDGEPGSRILPWLNELPAVKKVLVTQFAGALINSQNLSNWRSGGYQRWLRKQERLEEIKSLAEEARECSHAGNGLARGAAAIVAAGILKKLDTMTPAECTVEEWEKMSRAVTRLSKVEQDEKRLKHDQRRLQLQDEKLTLDWDKYMRKDVGLIQQALKDEQIKAIQALPIDNHAKIEMIGRRKWKDMWRARPLLDPEDGTGQRKATGEAQENGEQHLTTSTGEPWKKESVKHPPSPRPSPQGEGESSADGLETRQQN